MDTVSAPPPVVPGPAPPASAVLTAWPRSAQLTTAFLLGVLTTMLAVQLLGGFRWGARPAELERPVAYRIDLNRAPRAELLQIPGVGPAMADRIEEYRREHGGFRSVEDLSRVHGIGPATLARIRPWVCVTDEEVAEEPPPVPQRKSARTQMATASADDPPRPTARKKDDALAEPIDINRATREELQRLPGIGPTLSQRIIDTRAKAPFKTVDDLRRVPGIGVKTLEKLRPFVKIVESTKVVSAD